LPYRDPCLATYLWSTGAQGQLFDADFEAMAEEDVHDVGICRCLALHHVRLPGLAVAVLAREGEGAAEELVVGVGGDEGLQRCGDLGEKWG